MEEGEGGGSSSGARSGDHLLYSADLPRQVRAADCGEDAEGARRGRVENFGKGGTEEILEYDRLKKKKHSRQTTTQECRIDSGEQVSSHIFLD